MKGYLFIYREVFRLLFDFDILNSRLLTVLSLIYFKTFYLLNQFQHPNHF